MTGKLKFFGTDGIRGRFGGKVINEKLAQALGLAFARFLEDNNADKTKWEAMVQHLTIGPIVMGCLVAGVFAAISVFWLVGYLSRKGLGVFVVYRIILAVVVFAIYLRQ